MHPNRLPRPMNRCNGGPLMLYAAIAMLAAPALAAAPVDVRVQSDTSRAIVIEFTLSDYTYRSVEIDGQRHLILDVPHETLTQVEGAPTVPYITRAIEIPKGVDASVLVTDAQYDEWASVKLAPSKGHLNRTDHPDPAVVPYTFGEAYSADAFFPGELAALGERYILRDVRGMPVTVYPFQYNPVTETLRIYSSITVEVKLSTQGDLIMGAGAPDIERPSAAFEQLYCAHFINHSSAARYEPLTETGEMLIICHDPWLANVEPLAAHKRSIGIPTTVVPVSEAGATPAAIKAYIQTVYNTSNLAFVLLVGDADEIPPPTASEGPSDPSYSKLAGDDDYPDIMIGRFSAESAGDVDTQVWRTIWYEENQATTQDWFWKGTGIGSIAGEGQGDEGQSDWVHIDEIRDWLMESDYTHVDQIYDTTGATAAMVTAALNEGRGIVNYCGHGDEFSWSTTHFDIDDVNALVNDNKLPFIINAACFVGAFQYGTCFAEAWMRATHEGAPTGAIGIYASTIRQTWAEPMEGQDEFNLLYTSSETPYHCLGTLCYAGSCSMMDAYAESGVDVFNTWHLFGDPSLRVIGTTAPPTGMGVTPRGALRAKGQVGGPFAPERMVYTLENFDETDIAYEVRAEQDWVTITDLGGGVIPALSSVTVEVSIGRLANYLGQGEHAGVVTFENLTDHNGDTQRKVMLTVGFPVCQHSWPLDMDPLWNKQGEWAFGQPTGGGGSHGFPDPTSGATGTCVYGVDLNGDYSTASGGFYFLWLGPVDISGLTDVSLRFQRWLNSDPMPYVTNIIEASVDGTAWEQVWCNEWELITDDEWMPCQYDLAPIVGGQPTVHIRWGYKVNSAAWAYSGWNLDDIEIWGLMPATPPLCAGDVNCDGIVDYDDIDIFVAALGFVGGTGWPHTCPWLNADCTLDGDVNYDDIDAFVARIGQGCP